MSTTVTEDFCHASVEWKVNIWIHGLEARHAVILHWDITVPPGSHNVASTTVSANPICSIRKFVPFDFFTNLTNPCSSLRLAPIVGQERHRQSHFFLCGCEDAQMSQLNQQLTDCSLMFYTGVNTLRVISWGNANIFKHIPDSSWTEPDGTKSSPQINFTQRFFSALLTGSYSTDVL